MNAEHLLQFTLPFLGAALGVAVFSLGFKGNLKKLKKGDTAPIVVILISLLCTAYGVERLTYSTEISQIRDRLDKLLPSGTYLSRKTEIWFSISRLMLAVDQTVRSVQSGDRPSDVPAEFSTLPGQFRARLSERKNLLGGAVKYRVVLVFESPKGGKELDRIEQAIAGKKEDYKKAGLENVLELRVFDHKPLAMFDVTIVDTQHIIIGFDTAPGPLASNVEIQNALIWENQPAIAQKLTSWFDHTVWENAKPYEEWLANQKRIQSAK